MWRLLCNLLWCRWFGHLPVWVLLPATAPETTPPRYMHLVCWRCGGFLRKGVHVRAVLGKVDMRVHWPDGTGRFL